MGVPALFRWIQRRYPLMITNCIEEEIGSDEDYSNQNPNTIGDEDFDCLYLDMNGIIHPCFHSHGNSAPLTEAEIFQNIENYINRLFNIVRPRKLLFMAIDGVAPRAKMNQQRARRYRSSKDAVYNHLLKIDEAKKENDTESLEVLEDPEYFIKHDTNVITPGTQFMNNLAKYLQKFIHKQQQNVPAWKNISIILSDASVPGEGEHKIMDFIRGQRFESGYDPNRRHCIYGLDADLIFLGLTSHELYFTVLREKVLENVDGFQFVSLWVLRQYLEKDLKPAALPFDWNFENAIDDLVFLCFAIGNDFLPGVPGFNIQAGVINAIMLEYSHSLPKLGGYLTNNGVPNFSRLCSILYKLNKFEGKALDTILHPSDSAIAAQNFVNEICDTDSLTLEEMKYRAFNQKKEKFEKPEIIPNSEELKQKYYKIKFGDDFNKESIVKEYVTGMYWTLMYYTRGCASWSWFYPYHHPPCISDFYLIEDFVVNFELGEPFKPLVQLMSVLPPQSSHCLPKKMQYLMTNDESPLKVFYPTKFNVDLNGGTTLWKGFVLVPFIDANLLLNTINEMNLELNEDEIERNSIGKTLIFPCVNNMEKIKINENEFEVFGSHFWGKISKNDENSYFFEFKKVSAEQNPSFLLLNIKIPPCVVTVNQDPFMRGIGKKAKNKQARLKNTFNAGKEIPLQIPGYPPGTTSDYRIKVVNDRKPAPPPKHHKKKSSAFLF
ncbi:5'-3' exoribonuclease 2 [Tritrichomonas foetus]|uniref:5'-3' exoribonuclease n=1 Tax=Tritrichomonas foetus TaxID=1144522 RepID=A0A1J4L273_9EUKA|nr:5'-3' exoribonuclease 2 [Tritrichomonas foetus]|eukprot:OHT17547.1 5'-3' exoribonuclease 2 [Tritrichomonas foetus]